MQNKKWILGMVTVAGICLMTASLWPMETDAAREEHPIHGQADQVVQEETPSVHPEYAGQLVGSLEVSIEQGKEQRDDISEETEETIDTQVYLTKTAIRLREEPNTQSDILLVIDQGERVEVLGNAEENHWCMVRYQDKEGYLKEYHLKEITEEDEDKSVKTDEYEVMVEETEDVLMPENPKDTVENSGEKWEYLGNYYITGYRMFNASENGGRSDGVTASGVVGTPGYTVAMKDVPFGTTIYVDGLGYYVVEDRGVGEECVDIACNTISETYELTGYRDVYLIKK